MQDFVFTMSCAQWVHTMLVSAAMITCAYTVNVAEDCAWKGRGGGGGGGAGGLRSMGSAGQGPLLGVRCALTWPETVLCCAQCMQLT